jgi:hypothetical protein
MEMADPIRERHIFLSIRVNGILCNPKQNTGVVQKTVCLLVSMNLGQMPLRRDQYDLYALLLQKREHGVAEKVKSVYLYLHNIAVLYAVIIACE